MQARLAADARCCRFMRVTCRVLAPCWLEARCGFGAKTHWSISPSRRALGLPIFGAAAKKLEGVEWKNLGRMDATEMREPLVRDTEGRTVELGQLTAE